MSEQTRTISDLGQREDSTETDEFADVGWSLLKSADLLERLRTGPDHKRELADALGVSKSTVYNWTSELEQYNLLERTAEGYRLTYVGRRMTEQFFDWRERARRLFRLAPLADALPRQFDLPPNALEEATVAVTTDDPDVPTNEFLARLRDARDVSAILPVASSRCLDALAAHVGDDDRTLELVVPTGIRERLLATLRDDGRPSDRGCLLLVIDEEPSFGLVRFEGTEVAVGLTIYSTRGHLVGFVGMSSPESRTWATDVYKAYRRRARDVAAESSDADALVDSSCR